MIDRLGQAEVDPATNMAYNNGVKMNKVTLEEILAVASG